MAREASRRREPLSFQEARIHKGGREKEVAELDGSPGEDPEMAMPMSCVGQHGHWANLICRVGSATVNLKRFSNRY